MNKMFFVHAMIRIDVNSDVRKRTPLFLTFKIFSEIILWKFSPDCTFHKKYFT
jgi:hypothetical protein